ncbi:DUF5685 family protein [Emergencia sp.]|uniref:DUF5685 family protein n=1 Tax=Emergencia sp. TaxID=1926557 RepID=UPI0011DE040E
MTIEKNELKVREFDMYQAYYCGICKSIGRRFGQLPRMTLSYDSVFLALVLAGLSEETDIVLQEHCITHHIKKKPVVFGNEALDYAADVMVILAYHKFLDDWKDEQSKVGLLGKSALSGAYGKLQKMHPEICHKVEHSLTDLSELERENSGKLDLVADTFADIMETLFIGYDPAAGSAQVLGQLGRHLGKWIYTIDALDDYEKDIEAGHYNPLIFRENKLEGIGDLLYNYLAEASNAYDLLQIKKNKGIIDNIIFMGLRVRTDVILRERTELNEQSV